MTDSELEKVRTAIVIKTYTAIIRWGERRKEQLRKQWRHSSSPTSIKETGGYL